MRGEWRDAQDHAPINLGQHRTQALLLIRNQAATSAKEPHSGRTESTQIRSASSAQSYTDKRVAVADHVTMDSARSRNLLRSKSKSSVDRPAVNASRVVNVPSVNWRKYGWSSLANSLDPGLQFAVDAAVPSPRVVLSEATDQVPDLTVDRWPVCLAGVCPMPGQGRRCTGGHRGRAEGGCGAGGQAARLAGVRHGWPCSR